MRNSKAKQKRILRLVFKVSVLCRNKREWVRGWGNVYVKALFFCLFCLLIYSTEPLLNKCCFALRIYSILFNQSYWFQWVNNQLGFSLFKIWWYTNFKLFIHKNRCVYTVHIPVRGIGMEHKYIIICRTCIYVLPLSLYIYISLLHGIRIRRFFSLRSLVNSMELNVYSF